MRHPNRVAAAGAVRRFTSFYRRTVAAGLFRNHSVLHDGGGCGSVNVPTSISVHESGPWQAASPSEGACWLASLTVPWWIAGGWALDLFAGHESRPHKDLDVGILRKDALQVLASLAAWEVFEAKNGVLTRLGAGTQPRADVFSLWCRPAPARPWALELMLDEAENGFWIYRRHRQIQRPLEIAIRRSSQGIRYLAPEIQLLYKSHRRREQDQTNFEHIGPKLDQSSRIWLWDCLQMIEPAHPWLSVLGSNIERP